MPRLSIKLHLTVTQSVVLVFQGELIELHRSGCCCEVFYSAIT